MSRDLPNLGLKGGYADGDEDWGGEQNANLLKLSTLVQGGVSAIAAAEPVTPTPGQVVILDETNVDHPNAVAVWEGPVGEEAWSYFTPNPGWLLWDNNQDAYVTFDGTTWAVLETGSSGGGGGVGPTPLGPKRYWRLKDFTSQDGDPYVTASEVRFRETTGGADYVPTASTASSSYSSGPAVLYDGDNATWWGTTIASNPTLAFDLGTAKEVGAIRVRAEATDIPRCFDSVQLQYSDVGMTGPWIDAGDPVEFATWTSGSIDQVVGVDTDIPATAIPNGGTTGQVLTKKSDADGDVDWADPTGGSGGGSGYVDVTALAVSRQPHKFWRLWIERNFGSSAMAIGEIEMRATAGGVDQCVGGVATASSSLNASFTPDKAFANDGGTTFWVASTAKDEWIAYAFTTPVSVREIAMTSRGDGFVTDAPRDFVVQWSDDGLVWNDAWGDITIPTAWTAGQTRLFNDLAVERVQVGPFIGYGDKGAAMPATSFTATQGAGPVVTQLDTDSLLFTMTGGTGSPIVGAFTEAGAYQAGDFVYAKRIYSEHALNNFQGGGLMVRDGTTGQLLSIYIHYNSFAGGLAVRFDKWVGGSASDGSIQTVSSPPEYLRIRGDATNFYFEYSYSGKAWTTIKTVARTALIATPSQIGVFLEPWYESGTARNPKLVVRSMPSPTPVIAGGGDVGAAPLTMPKVADFPFSINNTSIEYIDRAAGLVMKQATDMPFQTRGLMKAAPAAPWNIYAKLDLQQANFGDNCRLGIGVKNTANGRLATFGFYTGSGGTLLIGYIHWNSETSYASQAIAWTIGGEDTWLRLENDGTNLKFYIGNGYDWILIQTAVIADFLLAVDQVGFLHQLNRPSLVTLKSWSFNAPA